MREGEETTGALRVEQSSIFLLSALLSLGFLAGRLLGPFGAVELVLRVLLTALLFAAPFLTRLASPARRHQVLASLLLTATLLVCAISALSGGPHSPEFSCLIAIPFAAGLVLPQVRAVVWGLGLLVLCFGGAMLLLAGASPSSVCMYAVLLVAGTAAAAMGTGVVRVLESRLAAAHAGRQAAERRVEEERQLAQSERLAFLGRLAAVVAHDMSNPLTYLSTNLQLLEREADALQKVSQRDVHAAVTESARAVENITDILRDLRRFARSEAVGQAAPTEVRAVVDEALLLASARLRGTQIERQFPQDLPRVMVRRRRLVQVLLNLLLNAADAVAALDVKERKIRITATRAEGGVCLLLEDSGQGLTPEARAHLFQPFFTTKPPGKGMGLGLALSREFVTADGGTLAFAESEKGGARVLLTLPVA